MESVITKMPDQRIGDSVRSGADDDNAVSMLGRGDAGRVKRLREMMTGRGKTLLSYTVVFLILIAGWNKRGDVYLSPEDGMGYALGIIGGVMMLSLLLYPLRKHVRWARILGNVRHWFRIHMVLGVLGPVAILYHCNFQLGSMNGNIALFSMLLVASSGLIGRYFYIRIHYGLFGRKADLKHLGSDAAALRGCMKHIFDESPSLREKLESLEEKTMQLPHGFLGSFGHVLYISMLSHWYGLTTASELRHALNAMRKKRKLDGKTLASLREISSFYMRTYFESIRRVAGLGFYERLFSLWHILHLPLFVMLVLTGIIHVLAVHMY